ncbi:MAG: hypothetical protein J7623_08570 [Chitinophaga sp.]|uniref:hypothetical protein n=1 Tax=Chitinophaga sp. TaxID=1869181 RepID=UPI001B0C2A4A|nr:hypothetical protein [Chitinophaga sp.]MBO9728676.1 hypothetical protein [Chitinophaga sp.]
MKATDITVYIDNKPYRFHVDVNYENETTTYQVSSANEKQEVPGYGTMHLQFNEDGHVSVEQNIETVEQEQLARLIWQEILNNMKP